MYLGLSLGTNTAKFVLMSGLKASSCQTGEIEEDGVLETVVISPLDRAARSSDSSVPLPPKDVGPDASKAPLGKAPEKPERLKGTVSEPEEEDSLAQTVVLSPDKLKDKGKGND